MWNVTLAKKTNLVALVFKRKFKIIVSEKNAWQINKTYIIKLKSFSAIF